MRQSIISSLKFNHAGYLILVGFCIISYLPWHDVEDFIYMSITELKVMKSNTRNVKLTPVDKRCSYQILNS